MHPASLQQREIEWGKLHNLLQIYEELYLSEQAFLVEVIIMLRDSIISQMPLQTI